MLRSCLYEQVRYEVERWPLWRLDLDLRYLAKHLLHRPQPDSPADAAFWTAQADWLSRLRAELPAAGGARLVAGGDLMWLRAGWDDFLSPGLRAHLAAADAALANLETPVVAGRPVPRYTYETPRYNAPPAYLDAWARSAPRSVLSLCNNHALDQGTAGLQASRGAVTERGLVCLGGAQAEAEAVALLEVGGLRLACLGLTFGINGLARGAAGPPGVPVLAFGDPRADTDWARVERLIARARALDPDWIVALPHWGYEYEYWPCARMRADAHRLLALGIDLIFGSSPHVLQPCEVASVNGWDRRAPTAIARPGAPPRPALVAYSLGNLASILPTAGCQVGALLGLRLDKETLRGLDALPTVCRRGLGCSWLAARAYALAEAAPLLGPAARRAYHHHAQRALGPLLKETAP